MIAKPAYAPWMTRDAKRATVMNVENIIRTKKAEGGGWRRVFAGRRIESGERLKGSLSCHMSSTNMYIKIKVVHMVTETPLPNFKVPNS